MCVSVCGHLFWKLVLETGFEKRFWKPVLETSFGNQFWKKRGGDGQSGNLLLTQSSLKNQFRKLVLETGFGKLIWKLVRNQL